MKRKSCCDKNQFNFHFQIAEGLGAQPLEGGSQEALSDFDFYLRGTLKVVIDACAKREQDPMDRFEVAARMSRKLGREITKSKIDQWIAMSTVQHRIHVDALKALCEVTGDWAPLHVFVESCGFKALSPDEALAAEYGSKMLFKRMIDTDLKGLLSDIDEQELRKKLMDRVMGGGS
jgi:hypothetical protein